MKKLILTLITGLLLVSCAEKESGSTDYVVKPLEREENPPVLKAKVLNDELLVSTPNGLELYKSSLILYANDGKRLLHIYDAETGELINSGGTIGSKVSELPEWGVSMILQNGNIAVNAYTKVNLYDVEKLVKGEGDGFVESIPLESKLISSQLVYTYSNGSMLFSNHEFFTKKLDRFYITDKDSVVYTYSEYLPAAEEINKNICFAKVFQRNRIKPDGTQLVCYSSVGGLLEILDVDAEVPSVSLNNLRLMTVVSFKHELQDPSDPYSLRIGTDDESIIAFRCITTADKYIYGIYAGVHIDEMTELEKKDNLDAVQNPYNLLIFDYEGNLVKEYDLDYSLTQIAVDEEKGVLYGVADDAGELKLVSYQF